MLYLIFIIIIALALRSYGINWDQGIHLHPDERRLMMVADKVHLFNNLNPDFFNYGSLPIYILRAVSQFIDYFFLTKIANYQGMLLIGRGLSIIFDIATIILIYKIASLLFSTSSNNNENKLRAKSRSFNTIALFSSFFYSIAFFPIQNTHFFVVDVFLTFFTTLLLFLLLKFLTIDLYPERSRLVYVTGIVFGAMLATKFSAIIFLPVITLILLVKNGNNLIRNIRDLSIFYFLSSIFFFIFMPYAFLNWQRYFTDTKAQIQMNSNPYIFPYTLQYVGTVPYLYYLKNIFLWGLGPIISILSLIGLLNLLFTSRLTSLARGIKIILFERSREQFKKIITDNQQLIIFFLFYLLYFLVIGHSAVKFMRYMLPLYPFFVILAGYGFYALVSFRPRLSRGRNLTSFLAKFIPLLLAGLGMTAAVIWTFMFVNIYSQKHTLIKATAGILKNIPVGSLIAYEGWDIILPLYGSSSYKYIKLNIYKLPDDEIKWAGLADELSQVDYLIIASNRLYVPLQKLSDCQKYIKCYQRTAEYYKRLFSGQLGFYQVAEYSVYPKLEIGWPIGALTKWGAWKLEIRDDDADESFTVYDHPKVIIFRRINKNQTIKIF